MYCTDLAAEHVSVWWRGVRMARTAVCVCVSACVALSGNPLTALLFSLSAISFWMLLILNPLLKPFYYAFSSSDAYTLARNCEWTKGFMKNLLAQHEETGSCRSNEQLCFRGTHRSNKFGVGDHSHVVRIPP